MSFTVKGTGFCVPSMKKTNDDFSKIVETNDEWIRTRTGIVERRILETGQGLTDLSRDAALEAIADARMDKNDIDLIICSTMQGDYVSPSLACVVQKELGIEAVAFDVNAACPGFIYALEIADAYIVSKKAKNVLVIAADAMSRLADFSDRATCVLFGDGAGAVVLTPGDDLLAMSLTTKGDETGINIGITYGNCPFNENPDEYPYLYMDGQEIYKFAVSAMCNDIIKVIDMANITKNDVTYVLPHQANTRIIDAARRRLKMPEHKFMTNIGKYGNTSSASIPILLSEMDRSGQLKNGDILVMSAFGGGLTTGACVLKWNK